MTTKLLQMKTWEGYI